MVKVRVRGQEMHQVNDCPHKYSSTNVCVCVCVCVCVFALYTEEEMAADIQMADLFEFEHDIC